jgi:FHS family L-fucose permease-like MFS transporter
MLKNKNNFLLPLILVTSLFFLWGLAYGLLDVLNKHFQVTMNITKQRSMLLQAAYFGAYFLVAFPAGLFMQKAGYKKGIIAGLILYAVGAILFYPSAENASFSFFLVALFIIASGLAFLETAANPYITVLGDPSTSEFRLNLSQSFNGIGSFIGPIIGGALFFSDKASTGTSELGAVKFVYIIIAAIVLVVAFIFFRIKMPEIKEEELVPSNRQQVERTLFSNSHFVWAVIAQFFYVAAQVGIAALFINYVTEKGLNISDEDAAYLLSGGMLLFAVGRFAGTALMKYISPARLLAIYAAINIVLCIIVMKAGGMFSIYCLMAIFFFESIMFPTIFALGVKNLGTHTKKASSFIITSIVGGALIPFVMGSLAEYYSTSFSYIVPLVCFIVVLFFGLHGYKIRNKYEKVLPDTKLAG